MFASLKSIYNNDIGLLLFEKLANLQSVNDKELMGGMCIARNEAILWLKDTSKEPMSFANHWIESKNTGDFSTVKLL